MIRRLLKLKLSCCGGHSHPVLPDMPRSLASRRADVYLTGDLTWRSARNLFEILHLFLRQPKATFGAPPNDVADLFRPFLAHQIIDFRFGQSVAEISTQGTPTRSPLQNEARLRSVGPREPVTATSFEPRNSEPISLTRGSKPCTGKSPPGNGLCADQERPAELIAGRCRPSLSSAYCARRRYVVILPPNTESIGAPASSSSST